ncbi:MAG: nitronate monooxygenase [Pseudomonadales bacterium]|nr:nitronate monooxygenase [Pseudomonadales bacterium]MBO7007508.1 nitronate monooxygenase [Pseudomonadales bacterium]
MTIQQLFDIQHAILQAPMVGAGSTDLVAAVSNAGGLGATGAAPMKPEGLRAHIREIREKTDQPFNVNLFSPASEMYDQSVKLGTKAKALLEDYHRELGLAELPEPRALFGPAEAQLDVLIDEKVPVISFHFGVEADHVHKIHAAGLKVISSATTIDEALTLEALGVDAVIAQGAEAGGHRGTFLGDYRQALIGTLALVPQIVDAVKIPVIAAGGIMDARGIVACRSLGAAAVQMGTAFLGCPETRIPPLWLSELKRSTPSRTTVTSAMSGKPARGLRNRYISEMESLDEPLLPYSLQYSMSVPLRKKALEIGNADFPTMWSGQGIQLLREIPAGELVSQWVAESGQLSTELAGIAI